MTRNSDRDAHRQISETQEIRRRRGMRVKLPSGVDALHCAVGQINGEDVLLLFTTDGLYSVHDGVAHKCPQTPARPFRRRSDDMDYRPLWYALVALAVVTALLWTTTL